VQPNQTSKQEANTNMNQATKAIRIDQMQSNQQLPPISNLINFDGNTVVLKANSSNNSNGSKQPGGKKTKSKSNRNTSLNAQSSSDTKLPSICTFTKIKPKPVAKASGHNSSNNNSTNTNNKQMATNGSHQLKNGQELNIVLAEQAPLATNITNDNHVVNTNPSGNSCGGSVQYQTDLVSNEMDWNDADFFSFFSSPFNGNADEFSINFDPFEPNTLHTNAAANPYTQQANAITQSSKQPRPLASSSLSANCNNEIIFEDQTKPRESQQQQYANITNELNMFLNPSNANESHCNTINNQYNQQANITSTDPITYYVESIGSPWEFDTDFNHQINYIESPIV
jgi:hypothetical protein